MVEIHLLANQIFALEDEDQSSRHFHALSSRFNARPNAQVGSSKPDLDDHRVVGVMQGNLVQIEVGEG